MTALLRGGVSGWHGGLSFPSALTCGPAAGGYSSPTLVTLSANQNINASGNPSWVTTSGGGLLVSNVAFTVANGATIVVHANIVTFAGCSFNSTGAAGSSGPTTITLLGAGPYAFNYCTFYADGTSATRIMLAINQGADAALTITNCDIADMKQAVQLFSGTTAGVTIANNYFHDVVFFAGDHSECVYAGAAGGCSNITVSGNTLLNPLNQTAAVYLHNTFAFTNCAITGNLLAGGDYTLYCGNASSTGIVITGNYFSTAYFTTGGFFGTGYTSSPPVWGSSGNVWAGNTWYDGPSAGQVIAHP